MHPPPPYAYRSCDAALLYGAGGFLGEEAELAGLRAAPPAGEHVAELFPGARYTRPPPRTIAGAGEAFREVWTSVEAAINAQHEVSPPSHVFAIPDAGLRDSVIYGLGAAEPFIVHETHRVNDRATVQVAEPQDLRAAPVARDEAVPLLLASAGTFNYGHWLVDDLPRLRAFDRLRERFPERLIRIVLTSHNPAIDWIRARSIAVYLEGSTRYEITFLTRFEARRFPVLYYASPVSWHPLTKSPAAMDDLAATLRRRVRRLRLRLFGHRLRERGLRAEVLRKRLYIDRRLERGRHLVNRDEILAVLGRRGFTALDAEATTFSRQVATVADAGIVVGGMGAAMTNTLFSARRTSLVYLAPEGWQEPFFWDLASVRGQRYHAVYGAGIGEGAPHERAFSIDPVVLDRVLRDL